MGMSIELFGASYTEFLGELESGANAGRLLNWLRDCVADEVAKAGEITSCCIRAASQKCSRNCRDLVML